jgi:predicted SnoaL-like aldol condensation-catalyzing enzyme
LKTSSKTADDPQRRLHLSQRLHRFSQVQQRDGEFSEHSTLWAVNKAKGRQLDLMFKKITERFGLMLILIAVVQPVSADEALTARNKEVVRNFYTTVLIGRDVDAAPKFLRADYIQHNPQVPTGLKGFMDAFRERFAQKLPPDYKRELLNVIGDNDIVVIYVRQSWTGKDGQHHQALGFDMFRVQDGMIAEHWDAD